jgi:hypothetical protein
VTYGSALALRQGLEDRLLARSIETGASIDRLRRRVLLERILARLQTAEPGVWVLKGGMALEVRLGDRARVTKDIDVGLRDPVENLAHLHDRLIEALGQDTHAARAAVVEPLRPAPTGRYEARWGC